MPGDTISVLVVDDQVELRQSIKRLISFDETMEVAGEAANGQEALEKARACRPDVILMDAHMPVMDGLAATALIAQEVPEASVIMTSVEGEHDFIRRALKAGARDFLVKPFTTDELVDTIKNVHRAELRRRRERPGPAPELERGRRGARGEVVTFFSTKGGVGKSVLLCNLAVALARQEGARVAIVDCDLQFGDTAILLDLYPSRTIANLVEQPPPWSARLLAEHLVRHEESGVDVLFGPSRPEFADAVAVEHVARALALLRETHDYVLVDTIPMFRNLELSILDASDTVLVVSTPERPAIKDVKLCLDLMANLNYPSAKVKVVVNRAGPGVPLDDVRTALRRDVDISIPSDEEDVALSVNAGRPFMLRDGAGETALGQAVNRLAALIAAVLKERRAHDYS